MSEDGATGYNVRVESTADMKGVNVLVKARTSVQVNQPSKCGLCSGATKQGVDCYCIQCSMYLCDGCLKVHSGLPTSKNHSLAKNAPATAGTTSSTFSSGVHPTCQDHRDRPGENYCEDCSVPICKKCMVKKHRDHVTTVIGVQLEKTSTLLDEQQQEAEKLLEQQRQLHKSMSKALKDLPEDVKQSEYLLENSRASAVLAATRRFEEEFRRCKEENKAAANLYTRALQRNIKESEKKISVVEDTIQQIAACKRDIPGSLNGDFQSLAALDISAGVPNRPPARPPLIQTVTGTDIALQTEVESTDVALQASVMECLIVQDVEKSAIEKEVKFVVSGMGNPFSEPICYSPEITTSQLPWSVEIMLRDDTDAYTYDPQTGVRISLVCDEHRKTCSNWKATFEYSFSIVHPQSEDKNITKGDKVVLTTDKNRTGDFYTWLANLGWNEYLTSGNICITARVKVTDVKELPLPLPERISK